VELAGTESCDVVRPGVAGRAGSTVVGACWAASEADNSDRERAAEQKRIRAGIVSQTGLVVASPKMLIPLLTRPADEAGLVPEAKQRRSATVAVLHFRLVQSRGWG